MKQNIYNINSSHKGFTLIEVLVSVIILSGSIVFALQIHSQNREQILYISKKGKISLEDSLFVADDALSYHKDTKEAYDVIGNYFRISDSKSREILKNISREYYIPEPIKLNGDDENSPLATIEEIKIKDKFSSSYFHFKINNF